MPVWNSEPGAVNRWRLSVVVEDKSGQRVSSNEIALALTEPLVTFTAPDVSGRNRLRRSVLVNPDGGFNP